MLFIRVPVFIFFIFCILAGVVWMGISAYQLFITRGEKAAAEVFLCCPLYNFDNHCFYFNHCALFPHKTKYD